MFGYPKDELWNAVIKNKSNVSQFWTYGKDAFLKQPVYSRDFPPCKYCETRTVVSQSKKPRPQGRGFL